MKKQPTEWKKILANHLSDKEFISKIYKELIQLIANKQPGLKMGRRPKQTLLQRRHTAGQQAHEKMLNVTNYQRIANQNHKEASPHTGQNGYHQNVYK